MLVSVIVPTYNRADLLRRTLQEFRRQTLRPEQFEVIVADDGSSDGSRDVVREFEQELQMGYHFQEDLGFRAAAARNGGARLARSPILAFADTGVLVGPGWVEAHHRAAGSLNAVVGYTYGYNPHDPSPILQGLDAGSAAELKSSLSELPSFRDSRHDAYEETGFRLDRLTAPWYHFFTLNVSVSATAFWRVGGFDEEFRGWGVEDMDFGYRLTQAGVRMTLSRDAWAIELPHDRDPNRRVSQRRNMALFASKAQGPLPELYWRIHGRESDFLFEKEAAAFMAWSSEARGLDVTAEIVRAHRRLDAPRVAIFGSGSTQLIEEALPGEELTLCDFDETLLFDKGKREHLVHTACFRVPFADQSFDAVVITSRMAGLWATWGEDILAEARRIAPIVHEARE
ncbi:glycosyltransferase [Actinoplanes sp. HUAS TT8]|uniref:glycosyltransferase n=1 Tax=Actinoplanes sp. HUAS TT8 TaxID=3447453 RepID=UPI003F526813